MKKATHAQAVQRRVEELEAIIRSRFGEAEFRVTRGREPVPGTYIEAYIDDDDEGGLEILNLVGKRIVEILVDEGISLFVIPLPKPKPVQYARTQADP